MKGVAALYAFMPWIILLILFLIEGPSILATAAVAWCFVSPAISIMMIAVAYSAGKSDGAKGEK